MVPVLAWDWAKIEDAVSRKRLTNSREQRCLSIGSPLPRQL
jgi:hypothetical protein